MNIKIREATVEDLTAINDINNYFITSSYYNVSHHPRTLEERLDWFRELKNLPVLVAETDGEIIGFSSLSKFRKQDGYNTTAEVSVYVHYEKHKMGIGQMLIKELVKKGKMINIKVLVSVITKDNEPSIRLHEKCGFTVTGVFPNIAYKNNKYIDMVFMTREV